MGVGIGVGVNRCAVAVAPAAMAVAWAAGIGRPFGPMIGPPPLEDPPDATAVPMNAVAVAFATASTVPAILVAVACAARAQTELPRTSITPKSTTAPKVVPIVISRRVE